eukprot:1652586-Rhodomonas_salina.1
MHAKLDLARKSGVSNCVRIPTIVVPVLGLVLGVLACLPGYPRTIVSRKSVDAYPGTPTIRWVRIDIERFTDFENLSGTQFNNRSSRTTTSGTSTSSSTLDGTVSACTVYWSRVAKNSRLPSSATHGLQLDFSLHIARNQLHLTKLED